MQTKKSMLFFLLISISACTFAREQKPTPYSISAPPISTQLTTSTPQPTPTNTFSPTLESSDRLCSPDDFQINPTPPDINQPETLIGFQPNIDWQLPNHWEKTIGIYNPDFDYSIGGYRNSNQHLFTLKKPVCRYGENKHVLAEIKDFILIPELGGNEIIIHSPTFEHCCFFQENIFERFDFKWEWFSTIDCTETHPRAIMLARYNINELPTKIEPGTHLSVEVITGWLPDVNTNTFQEFSTTGISCIISFQGA